MISLVKLQDAIQRSLLSEDAIWMATKSCERDLQNAQWSLGDVLRMLTLLTSGDYRKSEWCDASGGPYPCDVYVLPYDAVRQSRNERSAFEVYLKFSVTESGQLTLVLVSCHGSR